MSLLLLGFDSVVFFYCTTQLLLVARRVDLFSAPRCVLRVSDGSEGSEGSGWKRTNEAGRVRKINVVGKGFAWICKASFFLIFRFCFLLFFCFFCLLCYATAARWF